MVETRALARVLQEFADEWTRSHPDLAPTSAQHVGAGGHPIAAPSRRNGFGQYVGNLAVGAATILHERALQLPGAPFVPVKTIRKILRGETPHTELRVADVLVTAADRTHVFHDGTLPVIPNPRASSAVRARCC